MVLSLTADVLGTELVCCVKQLRLPAVREACTTPHGNISKDIYQVQNYTKIR